MSGVLLCLRVEPYGLPWIPRAAAIKVMRLMRSGVDINIDIDIAIDAATVLFRSFSFLLRTRGRVIESWDFVNTWHEEGDKPRENC